MVCAGSVVLLGFARLFHARPLRLLRDKTLAADSLARMVCMTAVEACDLGGLKVTGVVYSRCFSVPRGLRKDQGLIGATGNRPRWLAR